MCLVFYCQKSHIAAFINVLRENSVARLFMVLILIRINQCSSLTSLCMRLKEEGKKDVLFDCPVRLFKITDIIYTGLSVSFTDILYSCGDFEACGMHLLEA